eukprot:TRINITY_DN2086_c0_g1_i1.p1 TRINITY_DN2086_c0_g1~~TRINITY_DN2086_c0_g1_i1.p1  ORF type:complete len:222 (+),score=34.93 TRINITY_DN2086_c0_g1_i1:207-872(+)
MYTVPAPQMAATPSAERPVLPPCSYQGPAMYLQQNANLMTPVFFGTNSTMPTGSMIGPSSSLLSPYVPIPLPACLPPVVDNDKQSREALELEMARVQQELAEQRLILDHERQKLMQEAQGQAQFLAARDNLLREHSLTMHQQMEQQHQELMPEQLMQLEQEKARYINWIQEEQDRHRLALAQEKITTPAYAYNPFDIVSLPPLVRHYMNYIGSTEFWIFSG